MVAQNHIRLKTFHRFHNLYPESRQQLLRHFFVQIAVPGTFVGHFVGHAADGEGQGRGLVNHREEGTIFPQTDGIFLRGAADHCLRAAQFPETLGQFSQKNATAGGVHLLGGDA